MAEVIVVTTISGKLLGSSTHLLDSSASSFPSAWSPPLKLNSLVLMVNVSKSNSTKNQIRNTKKNTLKTLRNSRKKPPQRHEKCYTNLRLPNELII